MDPDDRQSIMQRPLHKAQVGDLVKVTGISGAEAIFLLIRRMEHSHYQFRAQKISGSDTLFTDSFIMDCSSSNNLYKLI
jgi:hypothetical protein